MNGTTVELTADPAPGSTFTGWTGCTPAGNPTCTVAMTTARTVTAGFGAPVTGDKTHDWEFRLLLNHALR